MNLSNFIEQQLKIIIIYKFSMSFFDLQQRNINQINSNNNLAPGQYDTNYKNTRKSQSYAPFGSLSTKHKIVKEKSIGPGQYNIQHPIVKPSISKYQNNNIIIVKINDQGGHQFKSKSKRFQTDISYSQIGPGTYDSDKSKRVRAASFSSANNYGKKIRDMNNKKLREKQPTLISDPVESDLETKETRKSKVKGTMNWDLNKKERFDPLIKQSYSEIQKQKALSEIKLQRSKKIKPSVVFSSKTIKSHLETQIYKTNNPVKAEIRKMIQFRDDQPGPGSYYVPSSAYTQKSNKYQFFGSTVQRFSSKQPQNNSIGPGYYKIESDQKNISHKRYQSNQKQNRHSYIQNQSQTPGVGSYSLDKKVIESSSDYKKYPFGSQKPRFASSYAIEQPIIQIQETYIQNQHVINKKEQKKNLFLKYQRKPINNQPNAIFSSNSKRFKTQKAEMGQDYDLCQNDINSKVERYKNLVKQLQQCQLHKPPFLSSDERFKTEKIVDQNHHKDCWCMIKSVQKQIVQHKSPVFMSNEKRIAVFQLKQKSPPVGYYNKQKNSIIQTSFNSRFKKQNQNAIKKSKILDRKYKNQNQQGNNLVLN